MTRAHVKLLGPCFKTGRMERGTNTTPENESGRIPPRGEVVPRAQDARPGFQNVSCSQAPYQASKRLAATDETSRPQTTSSDPSLGLAPN
jgi:hypothetical protein